MKPGIALKLNIESMACHNLINVTDNGNTKMYYCNDIDEESVFNVDHVVMSGPLRLRSSGSPQNAQINIWWIKRVQKVVPIHQWTDSNSLMLIEYCRRRPNLFQLLCNCSNLSTLKLLIWASKLNLDSENRSWQNNVTIRSISQQFCVMLVIVLSKEQNGGCVTLICCHKTLGWMIEAYKAYDYDTGDCGSTNSQHWFLLNVRVIFFLTLTKQIWLPKLNQTFTKEVSHMSHFGRDRVNLLKYVTFIFSKPSGHDFSQDKCSTHFEKCKTFRHCAEQYKSEWGLMTHYIWQ